MKKLLLMVGVLAIWPLRPAAADMVWNTPVGTIGLPFQATQALLGYDGILKQAIGGFSLPVYTDPKGIVTLQVGADAPWQSNGATVEPLIMAGHNILKEIPVLSQYKNAAINVFGRYSSETGKAGAGIAFSYAFAGI